MWILSIPVVECQALDLYCCCCFRNSRLCFYEIVFWIQTTRCWNLLSLLTFDWTTTKIRKVFLQQQQYVLLLLFFAPAQLCFIIATMRGVGSVFESKIVASLNRQLWLLCFCPPLLQSITNDKKRYKKESIFAFKIYFWCCLKQFEEGREGSVRL